MFVISVHWETIIITPHTFSNQNECLPYLIRMQCNKKEPKYVVQKYSIAYERSCVFIIAWWSCNSTLSLATFQHPLLLLLASICARTIIVVLFFYLVKRLNKSLTTLLAFGNGTLFPLSEFTWLISHQVLALSKLLRLLRWQKQNVAYIMLKKKV